MRNNRNRVFEEGYGLRSRSVGIFGAISKETQEIRGNAGQLFWEPEHKSSSKI